MAVKNSGFFGMIIVYHEPHDSFQTEQTAACHAGGR